CNVVVSAVYCKIDPVPDGIAVVKYIVLIQIIAVVLIVLANKRRVGSEENIKSVGEFSEIISVRRRSDVGRARSAETVIIVRDVEKITAGIEARLTVADLVGRIRAGFDQVNSLAGKFRIVGGVVEGRVEHDTDSRVV